jgi:hypothetical protein
MAAHLAGLAPTLEEIAASEDTAVVPEDTAAVQTLLQALKLQQTSI